MWTNSLRTTLYNSKVSVIETNAKNCHIEGFLEHLWCLMHPPIYLFRTTELRQNIMKLSFASVLITSLNWTPLLWIVINWIHCTVHQILNTFFEQKTRHLQWTIHCKNIITRDRLLFKRSFLSSLKNVGHKNLILKAEKMQFEIIHDDFLCSKYS